jgi:glutamine synthetase
MADRPETAEDVKALAQDLGIRFVRLWFTDILGQLKSFAIAADQLDDAFEGGMGFDGSSITGFNAIEESDMIAVPDPTTFNVLPWRPEEHDAGVARMFADVQTPERQPYEGDPRHVRRAVSAPRRGSTLNVGPLTSFWTRATRSSTRAATSTSPRWTPGPTCAARPCSHSSSSASTSSTPTTRSGPASTRSTCATPTR